MPLTSSDCWPQPPPPKIPDPTRPLLDSEVEAGRRSLLEGGAAEEVKDKGASVGGLGATVTLVSKDGGDAARRGKAEGKASRVLAIDTIRGFCLMGMIFVNYGAGGERRRERREGEQTLFSMSAA